jgi:surfactin synthase thioesterase subunit
MLDPTQSKEGYAMEADTHRDDVQAIEAVITRQFTSLCWTPETAADWDGFAADFFPEASLYPAARPAERQTVEAFIERMKDLAGTKLRSFEEAVLGTEIHVFGNVAVAVAACEMTENGAEVHRGVEMLLLIKNAAAWQIVSQAWDTESPSQPIPRQLLGGAARE